MNAQFTGSNLTTVADRVWTRQPGRELGLIQ